MPPTDQKFKAIEENWFSVRDNYEADLHKAGPSREQRNLVKANREAAEAAYLKAKRLGLAGAGMADALAALKAANAAVKDSREKGEAIDKLLAKATAATGKATYLVKKAGGG